MKQRNCFGTLASFNSENQSVKLRIKQRPSRLKTQIVIKRLITRQIEMSEENDCHLATRRISFRVYFRRCKSQTPAYGGAGVWGYKSLTMTYFHRCTSTIIGAKAFHGPVRDGKGWGRLAMVVKRSWLRASPFWGLARQLGVRSTTIRHTRLDVICTLLLFARYCYLHVTCGYFLF